jgi:hypothetical protein
MPEFQEYLMEESTRNIAGELTRKEAGYICEILTAAALREGKNVRTKKVSAMFYLLTVRSQCNCSTDRLLPFYSRKTHSTNLTTFPLTGTSRWIVA